MSSPTLILCFLCIALFWGGSFLAIGIAVQHLPPFWSAFIRVSISLLIITVYLLAKERKIERPKVWLQSMGAGAFLMGIPWLFLFWGEKQVAPAIAAVLNSTVPLFTTLLAPFLTPEEKPSLYKWLGVLVGFLGVWIIFFPEISWDFSLHLQGMAAILMMSLCYAIGTLWTRRIAWKIRNPIHLFYQSLSGGLILIAASSLFELPHHPSLGSWPAYGALIYLGVFSTAIAWLLFFRLIKEAGSIQASAVTYCVPPIAMLLDFFFWDKWISPHQALGACVILVGVFLIHRRLTRSQAPRDRM